VTDVFLHGKATEMMELIAESLFTSSLDDN